jgi:hypothetical protein
MEEALRDAEAIRYADQVVRDTQPSGRAIDQAPFYRDAEGIKKAFLQFQLPMSVIFQNIFFDMPAAVRNGRAEQLFVTLGVYAFTAVAAGALSGGWDDDDFFTPRGIAAAAAGGLIESLPVIGNAASRGLESLIRGEKIRPSMWNLFPVLQSAEKAVNAVQNKKWGDAARAVADGIFYYTGLPVALKNEIEKALEKGDWAILLGVK